jgi:hypothetical protein
LVQAKGWQRLVIRSAANKVVVPAIGPGGPPESFHLTDSDWLGLRPASQLSSFRRLRYD